MATFEVEFTTQLNVTVTIEADDEDTASDKAWRAAEDYAQTIWGDPGAGAERREWHPPRAVRSLTGFSPTGPSPVDRRRVVAGGRGVAVRVGLSRRGGCPR